MSAKQTQEPGDKVQPDINDLKRSEWEAKAARDYAEAAIRTGATRWSFCAQTST